MMHYLLKNRGLCLLFTVILSSVSVRSEPTASEPPLENISEDSLIEIAQKGAYAIGCMAGKVLLNQITARQDLGVPINKADLFLGFEAVFSKEVVIDEAQQTKAFEVLETITQQFDEKRKIAERNEQEEKGKLFQESFAKKKGVVKTASGLLYLIHKKGAGLSPTSEDTITAHYKGLLINGKEFDSSYQRNQPATFSLSQVIPCWKEALPFVKSGGKITIVSPPELAYGPRGTQGIPGNATLLFEIELLSVEKKQPSLSKEKGKITENVTNTMAVHE